MAKARLARDGGAQLRRFLAKSTYKRWVSQDMSPEAQAERHALSGRHSSLTSDEKAAVLQLAREQRENHRLVDTEWAREAIASVTQGRIPHATDSLISRFWSESKWPLRRVQERTHRELRNTLLQEARDFQGQVRTYVQEHHIPPANIYVADETGMWNGSVALRTRVDPATLDTGVERNGDGQRDTGMVALSAAGEVDGWFLEHQPQVTRKEDGKTVIVQKRVAGMGTTQMMEWSRGFVERHAEQGENVLMLDRLGCHRNKQVLATLEAGGVKTFSIPPQASKYISPCDNSFFASLKARLRRMDTSTTELKGQAFTKLCEEFEPAIVCNFFKDCGWEL